MLYACALGSAMALGYTLLSGFIFQKAQEKLNRNKSCCTVFLKVHVKWLLASVLTIVPFVIAFTTPKFIFLSILGLHSLTSPDRDEPAFHTALYNFCLWDGTPNEPCCARPCRGRCLIGPFCRSRRRRAREAMADRELRVHIARFVLARYAVHQSYVARSGSYSIEDQEEYSQMERRYDRMLKTTADLSVPARAFAVGGAPLLNTRPDGTHAPPGAETACEVEARRILRGADSIVRGPVVRTANFWCTRVVQYTEGRCTYTPTTRVVSSY